MEGKQVHGLKRLRLDLTNLPPRYKCQLDPEIPEHLLAAVEGHKLELWLDDVSLYPKQHIATVFPAEDSDKPIPLMLSELQVTGDIAEMILTILSIISSAPRTPKSDGDAEMTERNADDEYSDGNEWVDNWDCKLPTLLLQNYEAVMNCDIDFLQDVAFLHECLEGLIWTKTPIIDLMDANVFTLEEADTWGLCKDFSLWILIHVGNGECDFKIYIRQADHDATPRDIIRNLVRKSQVLCVLETFISKTITRLVENTVVLVGKLVLERLQDISKYCSICGDKSVDIPSLKPFCCSNALCQYQFMYIDLNGELEDILINEPMVADLLIQLAYHAAYNEHLTPYPDCLAGTDDNCIKNVKEICQLLHLLPSVNDLSEFAKLPNGLQENLKLIDSRLLPLLRWVIMSNTAHLKRLSQPEQLLSGLENEWHQFKMTISTPAKEAIFQAHKEQHKASVFAFHGSPIFNWHSILRTGLNFDRSRHGRSYGDGIYNAFNIQISMGYTTLMGRTPAGRSITAPTHDGSTTQIPSIWRNAMIEVTNMISVNEIVLDTSTFLSTNPYLVVNDPEKVQTRYLLVRGIKDKEFTKCEVSVSEPLPNVNYHEVPHEYRITSTVSPYLHTLHARHIQTIDVVRVPQDLLTLSRQEQRKKLVPVNELDLPSYASNTTTKHLQKELRNLLKTKSEETSFFHIDKNRLDNLYTWHAYLYNFPPELPLSQDLDRLSLPHVEVEMKFGPKHPHTPPYIRVVQPRFLPFSQGGGGHVTAGGSICLSMLTMDDWNPVYSISQVLVMVHSVLSSVDPRPARISHRGCYNEREAMDAYLRVARDHQWEIPKGWENFFHH